MDKVKESIAQEIKKLQEEGVGDDELNDMKRYLKGNFKAAQETNSSLGFMTTLDELYGLGYNHYEDYEKNIDAVLAQDIKNLAVRYLNLNSAAIVVTHPPTVSPTKTQ